MNTRDKIIFLILYFLSTSLQVFVTAAPTNSKEQHSSEWKRPPGPLNVWKVIDGKRNGQPARFTIQEIPVDRYEDVLDHMCANFINGITEPVSAMKDDPMAIGGLRMIWRSALQQGVSIGVFTDNPNGGKPILVGVNLLFVQSVHSTGNSAEIMAKIKSPLLINYVKSKKQMVDEIDIKSKFGIEELLYSSGLTVMPSFRGQSFGRQMLDSRKDICQKYGLKATATVFVSPVSMKLAERLGFEVLNEKNSKTLLNEENEPLFPNCRSIHFKYMMKKYC